MSSPLDWFRVPAERGALTQADWMRYDAVREPIRACRESRRPTVWRSGASKPQRYYRHHHLSPRTSLRWLPRELSKCVAVYRAKSAAETESGASSAAEINNKLDEAADLLLSPLSNSLASVQIATLSSLGFLRSPLTCCRFVLASRAMGANEYLELS